MVRDSFNIDLNAFEQDLIQPVTNPFAFETELTKVLCDPRYSNIKDVFYKLFGKIESPSTGSSS